MFPSWGGQSSKPWWFTQFCKGVVCQLCSPKLLLGLWIRSTLFVPTEPRTSAGAMAGGHLSGNEGWVRRGNFHSGGSPDTPQLFCYELGWKSEIWKSPMRCIFRNYSGKKKSLNKTKWRWFVSTFLLYKNGKTRHRAVRNIWMHKCNADFICVAVEAKRP